MEHPPGQGNALLHCDIHRFMGEFLREPDTTFVGQSSIGQPSGFSSLNNQTETKQNRYNLHISQAVLSFDRLLQGGNWVLEHGGVGKKPLVEITPLINLIVANEDFWSNMARSSKV